MKARKVRCYRGYASVPGRWNIEVFCTVPDMYLIKLFTWIQCGEIFVIDFENPSFRGKTAEEIAGDAVCPKCGKPLNRLYGLTRNTFARMTVKSDISSLTA